jgi:uncharacterized protein YvpB
MNISLEFEQIFIIGLGVFLFLILHDILALSKAFFLIIVKNFHIISEEKFPYKYEHHLKFNDPQNQESPLPARIMRNSKGFILKIPLFLKSLTKRLVILIISPFDFKGFLKNSNVRKSLGISKFKVEIPFLILWGIRVLLVNLLGITAIYALLKGPFTRYPQIVSTYPSWESVWNDYTKPIEVIFDIPIDEKSLILNMAPDTKGTWEFEKSFPLLSLTRKAKFYPDETVFPNSDILIYLTDLSNHFHTVDGGEQLLKFKSISLPEINSTTPEDNMPDVPIDQNIVINLNQRDGQYLEWEFVFEKEVIFETKRNTSTTIILELSEKLKQGETYTLEIFQTPISYDLTSQEVTKRGDKQKVHTLTFTTVRAPLVSSVSPEGSGILPNARIEVVFDNAMDQKSVEEAFLISPEINGDISWTDERTLIFTPESQLPLDTQFEVSFMRGIKSTVGGVSEEDIKFSFSTIGAVRVSGWYPGPGTLGVQINTSINVTFNQPVDHSSAQSHFSVSPSISGSFSWSGNTMVFTPSSNLTYNTSYTITIGSPVTTVYGRDSNQTFSSSFTTETNIFILNVPLYSQTHTFTCNVTAASMLIGYKGIPTSEMTVYYGLAKDNTPCDASNNTWGNPNVGYLGDIDGDHDCADDNRGYGVYWEPVSNYMSSLGIPNRVYRGWNVADLAREVEQGHPAMVWWQNGWARPDNISWYTPGGQYIYAVNGMHSEVIVGFIGPSSNPTHIITNDPWRGRRTLTVSYFNYLWGAYFNRTALVVY